MKQYFICLLIFSVLYTCLQAQDKYIIHGKLNGYDDVKVRLFYKNNTVYTVDSVITKKGSFVFEGIISGPVKAIISIELPKTENAPVFPYSFIVRNEREFYIEKGIIRIEGRDLKTARIRGGEVQSEYHLLEAKIAPILWKADSLLIKWNRLKNEEDRAILLTKLEKERSAVYRIKEDYIHMHRDSYVALDLLAERFSVMNVSTFEPFFNALSERMKNTMTGRKMADRLAIGRKTEIGQPAMDFTQAMPDGKSFSLTSLKGKYVLIDFWASWCGPCRHENPYLLQAYRQFSNKFEIVGISLDDKKNAWIEAVKKDSLPWIQISDLKGWKNDIAVEYGINMVPQNFLIDPRGIIVAKNLRGKELSIKLAEIIKD